MAKGRQPWDMRPASKAPAVSATLKAEVERKAKGLIDDILKPKYVQPVDPVHLFNHIVDIRAKWYRNSYYFYSVYAVPGPNAIMPFFESKFARMEVLHDGTFALYFMRHNGREWVGIYDALTLEQALKALQEDGWFAP